MLRLVASTSPLLVKVQEGGSRSQPPEIDPLQDGSIGLFQRFKKTFKLYGKILTSVHMVLCTVWFGIFYYVAVKGVNLVPFLEFVGSPESVVGLMRDSSSGYVLTAYAIYHITTPVRYMVTLGVTSMFVQYLRKHGHLPPHSSSSRNTFRTKWRRPRRKCRNVSKKKGFFRKKDK